MKGRLVVFTYTTKAVLPLEDTEIYVTNVEKTELIAKMTTDADGKTNVIELEAPDVNNSLSPDTNLPIFRSISIYARKNGYFNLLINGVQVFAGNTSIQNIMMIPLPENYVGDNTEVVEIPPQNL
ncbi:MAG: hypothetical protein PUK83_06785 [Clostridia bacterium]|nr:hypothetical protein [Clostridia bacterium]MDY5264526.1 hypothetical protein [Eubacteriales bacterium]MDY5440169.1 hypothetical protein [Eubacteriales bacterium]